jgi:DNA-binding beta-propeller fold protein YncE
MKYLSKNQLGALALITLLFACDNGGDERPLGKYDTGILLMNEGAFGANDGEVFHLDPASGTLTRDIFELENKRPFAGLLEDMVLEEDRLYLVANTGKVEIVNPGDFKSVGSVGTGLDQPRSLEVADNKIFISDYGPYEPDFSTPNSYIAVVASLEGGSVKKKIEVSNKPEDLFVSGSFVWVAGSEEGKVEVIDARTETVVRTLEVKGQPVQFFEKGGDLWLYSYDATKVYFQSFRLDNFTPKNLKEIGLPSATNRMALGSGNRIYVITSSGWPDYRDAVAIVNFNDNSFVADWKKGSGFYGIGFDSNRNELYVANAKGFQGNGEVVIFSEEGTELRKMEVGRGPSGFLYR